MKNKTSFSALIIAWCRAYHAENDDPKIFDDYLARHLLTEEECADFDKMIARSMKVTYYIGSGQSAASVLRYLYPRHLRRTFEAMAPKDRSQVSSPASAVDCYMHTTGALALAVSRARYTEDRLVEAVKEGVGQYVILGAGMDTFAFRRPDLLSKLQVFEVDHPATQAVKRKRLAELGWEIPQELHFIPLDFTCQRLDTALRNSPYDPNLPTFFNWLGVTYYLPRKTVFDTLRTVAATALKGSTIIFDYLDTDAYDHAKVAPRGQWLLLSLVGAKAKSGFDPSVLSRDLAALGLRLKEDMSPSDIEERYFSGYSGSYHAQEHAHFACAVVE